jgi:hypothetical protein
MLDKAIIVENKIKEMEKNGKRKAAFLGQSSGRNIRPHFPQSGPFFRNPSMARLPMHGQRPPFYMQQPSFQTQRPNFQIQTPQPQAHRANVHQPSHQSMQHGPHPTAPTSQNAPAQGSCNGRAYFMCGLTGHLA